MGRANLAAHADVTREIDAWFDRKPNTRDELALFAGLEVVDEGDDAALVLAVGIGEGARFDVGRDLGAFYTARRTGRLGRERAILRAGTFAQH